MKSFCLFTLLAFLVATTFAANPNCGNSDTNVPTGTPVMTFPVPDSSTASPVIPEPTSMPPVVHPRPTTNAPIPTPRPTADPTSPPFFPVPSSQAPLLPPVTQAPTQAPTKAPTRAPTKAPTQAPTQAPTRAPAPGVDHGMLEKVNAERRAYGLQDLVWNEELTAASKAHSQDMVNQDYFSHYGLDGSLPSDRAKAAGYDGPVGENIAYGYEDYESVMVGWMNSKGHRENILGADYKSFGFGVVDQKYTQMFGGN